MRRKEFGMAPDSNGIIGFEKDIKPLFGAKDRDAMRASFDLWDYSDVVRVFAGNSSRCKERVNAV